MLPHCPCNFHAYMNPLCACIKILDFCLLIYLLFSLLVHPEELRRLEKKYNFFSPHKVIFLSPPDPHYLYLFLTHLFSIQYILVK